MKKRVLIIGNSITRGFLGASYVKLLKRELPTYHFVNKGIGGDTLIGIKKRLLKNIMKNNYDIIIISAGHNDIIIPQMDKMKFFYRFCSKLIKFRGSIPTRGDRDFSFIYEDMIKKVKKISDSKIILLPLSCISEDLSSSLNIKREVFNEIIKEIGEKYNCVVPKIDEEFNKLLLNSNNKYFLDNIFNTVFDVFKPINSLSKKRKLKLTIDGIHLNLLGANIYKQEIMSCLKGEC